MNNEEWNYEVTPISTEYFKQRSFGIVFDVFNTMQMSEDELIKDYVERVRYCTGLFPFNLSLILSLL